jgi:hypothetical protein
MSGQPVPVVCDICEAPFLLAPRFAGDRWIFGLIVCTQCTEDNLDASTFEPRAEVGLVGSGGCR